MPLLHSSDVDRRFGCLLAIFSNLKNFFKNADGMQYCTNDWNEVFGLSLSFANYLIAIGVFYIYIYIYTPIALLVILYSVIVIKLKTQKIPGEQSVNAEQQRNKRNRNVLKMASAIVFGVCTMLGTLEHCPFTILLCPGLALIVAFGSMTISPTLWLTRIVPSTLVSVLCSVAIIVRDLKDS